MKASGAATGTAAGTAMGTGVRSAEPKPSCPISALRSIQQALLGASGGIEDVLSHDDTGHISYSNSSTSSSSSSGGGGTSGTVNNSSSSSSSSTGNKNNSKFRKVGNTGPIGGKVFLLTSSRPSPIGYGKISNREKSLSVYGTDNEYLLYAPLENVVSKLPSGSGSGSGASSGPPGGTSLNEKDALTVSLELAQEMSAQYISVDVFSAGSEAASDAGGDIERFKDFSLFTGDIPHFHSHSHSHFHSL
jgi:hypothetical protein